MRPTENVDRKLTEAGNATSLMIHLMGHYDRSAKWMNTILNFFKEVNYTQTVVSKSDSNLHAVKSPQDEIKGTRQH